MANDKFKIELGVGLGKSSGTDLQKEIDRLAKGLKDIDIKVDSSSLKQISTSYSEIAKTGQKIQTINAQLVNQQGQLVKATISYDDETGEIIKKKTQLIQTTKAETIELKKQVDTYQKIRDLSEKNKNATSNQNIKEANALLSKQQSEYQAVWDINKKIASLNPNTNSQEISALEQQKKYHQENYVSLQKQIETYSAIVNNEQRVNNLLDIRKQSEQQINTIKAKQADTGVLTQTKNLEKLNKATIEAYKTNDKMNSSIEIVSNRANAASKNFNTYVSSLNSSKIKGYETDIKKVSKAFELASKSGKQIDLTKANSQLKNFKAQMDSVGASTRSFTDDITYNIKKFAEWTLSATTLMAAINSVKGAVSTVIELDESIVDLQMATGNSLSETKELMNTYIDMGQELGATGTEVASAASDYLRQGKSIAETNTLIKDSMILSKIGKIESADATTYLTTAMKGYKVEVEDVIGIVDKLSSVDMASATSAGGLAEGMAQVATNANMAGISMDKLLGYLAVVGETTGESMSSVGNSFSTIFSRMANIKLSRLTDPESGEDLSNVETSLKNVGIALRDDNQTFRNFGDVLDDIAGKWDGFSEVNQRAIASSVAGKDHMEDFLVLMENYGQAQKYMSVSADSSGTALEKFGNYEVSVGAKAKILTSSLQELATDTLDSGVIKGFLDASNALVVFADNADLLKNILAGLSVMGVVTFLPKLVSGFKDASESMLTFGTALNTVGSLDNTQNWTQLANTFTSLNDKQLKTVLSTKSLSSETVKLASALKALDLIDSLDNTNDLASAVTGLSAEQAAAVLSTKTLNQEIIASTLVQSGLATAEEATAIATSTLTTATNTATTATGGLTASMSALKAAFLTNPVGLVITGVTLAVSALTLGMNKYKQQQEEAIETAKQASTEAKSQTDNISTLSLKYKELSDSVESNSSAKEDLLSTQSELLSALGIEESQIDSLVTKYGSLDEAINQVTLDSLNKAQGDLISGVGAYRDELLDAGSGGLFGTKDNLFIGELGEYSDLIDKLKNANISGTSISESDNGLGYFNLLGDDSTVDGILQNYNALIEAQDVLKQSYSSDELSNNDFFTDLTSQINKLKESVDNYNTSITDLNNNSAQSTIITNLMGKDLPQTQDEFESFKQSIIDSAIASDDFIGSQEDISNSIIDTLANMPQFSAFFNTVGDSATETANAIESAFDFESNKESIDDFQSKLSTLSDALAKINSGEMSGSDLIDLWQAFPSLEGETDNLSSAIQNLINNNLNELESTLGENVPSNLLDSLKEISAQASLDSIKDSMSELDELYANFIKGDSLDLSSLSDAFTSLDGYQNFADVLNNTSSTADQVKQAFGSLTDEYIKQTGILDNLNFSTAEQTASQLKKMGIANAEEVVYAQLGVTQEQYAQIKQLCTDRGIDLANATYEEIQALINENNVSQETAQAIYAFALKKEIANGIVLSTSGDIQNLMALVTAVGGATSALSALNAVKSGDLPTYGVDGKEGYDAMVKAAEKEVTQALDKINSSNQAVSNSASTIDYSGGAKTADALSDSLDGVGDSAEEAKTAVEELADAISKLESDYDNMATLLTDRAEKIQDALKLEETKGNLVSPKFYKELISESNKEMSLLNKKISEYQSLLDKGLEDGTITKYDDNWYKLKQGIADTKDEIMSCTTEIEEFQNAINELKWEKFELLTTEIDNITSEIDGLLDLLDNKSLVNDDGTWTDEGITSLALLAEQYEASTYKAQQYAQAIDDLEKDYKAGKYSTLEYMEKLAELKDAQLEATNTAEEERQAIIELNKERVEAAKSAIEDEIDAYSELIEKKKEALETAEDEYQLQKKLNEQASDVDTIQSKIDALSGDTSVSGVAKRRQLEAQLAEAQSDLDDTYYDNAYDAMQDALDEELEKYKETKETEISVLEASLENEELLIATSLATVQANYETVYSTLNGLANDYNLTVSDAIINPWTQGESAIASYGETLSNSTSAFIEQLNSVKTAINDIASAADSAASSILNALNNQDVGTADASDTSGSGKSSGGSGSGGGSSSKVNGYQVVDSSGFVIKQFSTKAEADAYAQKIATSYAKTKGKTVSVSAYKNGTRDAKAGAAIVDEEGLYTELLLGKTNEGRWRIMNDGDQVFTKAQTDNLFNLSNINPSSLLTNVASSSLTSSIPSITTNSSSNNVQIGSLVTITGSVSDSNLNEIKSLVKTEINSTFKNLNYTLKKSGA